MAKSRTPFADPEVQRRYASYPDDVREALLDLRETLFEVAAGDNVIGPLTEGLRWGEPSYLTEATKSGSTVRLAPFEGDKAGVFFNCNTTLVEEFRDRHGDALRFSKNRAIVIDPAAPPPADAIAGCAHRAFTYFAARRPAAGGARQ